MIGLCRLRRGALAKLFVSALLVATSVLSSAFAFTANASPQGHVANPEICTGEGVFLFEHTGYGGRCSRFTPDHWSYNLKGSNVGGDKASSIIINGCYVAYLFQHDNMRGTWEYFAENDANLHNNEIGNDTTSSIEVYGPYC